MEQFNFGKYRKTKIIALKFNTLKLVVKPKLVMGLKLGTINLLIFLHLLLGFIRKIIILSQAMLILKI